MDSLVLKDAIDAIFFKEPLAGRLLLKSGAHIAKSEFIHEIGTG